MEDAIIEEIGRIFRAGIGTKPTLDLGDDCAVLPVNDDELVVTVDAQHEHVHFKRDWMTLDQIGYRATMAAASDLAAMGARPTAIVSALALSGDAAYATAISVAKGQARAAAALGCRIVGGNVTRSSVLSITTTVLGAVPIGAAVSRANARPGDQVWVVGNLGWAHAGLLALMRGVPETTLCSAFREPVARIEDGLRLRPVAHAMMDVSDGLSIDARRLALASGVAIDLMSAQLQTLVRSEWGPQIASWGLSPIECILHGGEDYALLCTVDASAMPAMFGAIAIGRVHAGTGVALDGRVLNSAGFAHFERPSPK